MMVICHSNKLLSSTRPAENPSTGLFVSSAHVTHASSIPATLSPRQFLEGVLFRTTTKLLASGIMDGMRSLWSASSFLVKNRQALSPARMIGNSNTASTRKELSAHPSIACSIAVKLDPFFSTRNNFQSLKAF